jgi:peptidoglycan/xylan/chitin deacetylase (PgdA/CDA1 family)
VGTPAVLDALAATATTATFFLLSAQATAHPGVVGDLLAAGHTVGLHSDRHERLDRVPLRALTTRLADARRRLEDLIGAPVQWHRPPFGRLSWRGSLAARRAGLAIALWNEAPRDWQAANVAELAARLGPCLRAGALLALHDGDDPPGQAFVTAGALRLVLGAGTPEGVALGPLPPPDAARCVKPLRPHW